jgi:hypothetical protein
VAHDAQGQPKTFVIRWALDWDVAIAQDTVYDLPSGNPIAALRSNGDHCYPPFDVGVSRGALLTQSDPTQDIEVARGTFAELTTAPRFQCAFTTTPDGVFPQETRASDTTYAFDLGGGGAIVRSVPGSAGFAFSSGNPYLNLDFIEGDDVFGQSDQFAWFQEYLVLPDGSTVLYRGKPGRHMTAFRTDGTTMCWVESYGNSDPGGIPTTFEVWAAPYTHDPNVLDATARNIASVTSQWSIFDAIAFGGLYVVSTGTTATAVRLSDGATTKISSGDANIAFTGLLLVAPRDVWSIMSEIRGPGGFAVHRYDLGTW